MLMPFTNLLNMSHAWSHLNIYPETMIITNKRLKTY